MSILAGPPRDCGGGARDLFDHHDRCGVRAADLSEAERATERLSGHNFGCGGLRRRPIPVKGPGGSWFGDHLIHDGLDLEVRSGEVLGLVGGSGAGKTVLLNTLIGLEGGSDGGQVSIFGHDLATVSDNRLGRCRAQWGILFQQGALLSNLTVLENVVCAADRVYPGWPRR